MINEERKFGPHEYLCYQLLVSLDRECQTGISRSKFVKLSCIADHYLQETLEIDIQLPRYWYIYGDVLDEHALNGEFYNAPAAKYWNGQQYFPRDDINDWEFDVPHELRSAIDEAVAWTVRNLGSMNADNLTRYQFDRLAPNEFIATLDTLRRWLERTNYNEQRTLGDFQSELQSTAAVVRSTLDKLEQTYPREDYPEMYGMFTQWLETVRRLLVATPDYHVIAEFLDCFINTLSRVELRFHHCQYIPDARIREWEADRILAKEVFREQLRSRRAAVFSTHGTQGSQQIPLGLVTRQH